MFFGCLDGVVRAWHGLVTLTAGDCRSTVCPKGNQTKRAVNNCQAVSQWLLLGLVLTFFGCLNGGVRAWHGLVTLTAGDCRSTVWFGDANGRGLLFYSLLFGWGRSRLAWFGDANGRGLPFYSLLLLEWGLTFYSLLFHDQFAVHYHPMTGKGAEEGIAAGLVWGLEVDGRLVEWVDDIGVADDFAGLRYVLAHHAFGIGY